MIFAKSRIVERTKNDSRFQSKRISIAYEKSYNKVTNLVIQTRYSCNSQSRIDDTRSQQKLRLYYYSRLSNIENLIFTSTCKHYDVREKEKEKKSRGKQLNIFLCKQLNRNKIAKIIDKVLTKYLQLDYSVIKMSIS